MLLLTNCHALSSFNSPTAYIAPASLIGLNKKAGTRLFFVAAVSSVSLQISPTAVKINK